MRTKTFAVRARGELACFTRPEFRVERVTAPVITPSAARGMLEAVLFKPAIVWRIERICILAPMRYLQFRRNEVNARASVRNIQQMIRGGPPMDYFADEDRAQRNTLALRDVDYAIYAHMETTNRWGASDSIRKFEEIFERRLTQGQQFTQPVMGCREFPAYLDWYEGLPKPLPINENFGQLLLDIRYGEANEAVFFEARCVQGEIEVPHVSFAEVIHQ